MVYELYENPRYNCIHVTLAAMLQRMDLDVELLFHQAGLYFHDVPVGGQPYVLDPYYRSFVEGVREYFHINVETEEGSDRHLFVQRIQELLANGHSVGVFTDVHSIDYSHSFLLTHYLHNIEITAWDQNTFTVFDHYYHRQEQMELSKLLQLLREYQEGVGDQKLLLYYLISHEPSEPAKHNHLISIASNYRNMNGERSFMYHDSTTTPGIVGWRAIPLFGERIIGDFHQSSDEMKGLLTHAYTCLKEVSNSRHHCHVYMTKFGEEELSGLYLEAHQSWTVLSNLLMRASMFPSAVMERKLVRRLEMIEEQEKGLMIALKNRLDCMEMNY